MLAFHWLLRNERWTWRCVNDVARKHLRLVVRSHMHVMLAVRQVEGLDLGTLSLHGGVAPSAAHARDVWVAAFQYLREEAAIERPKRPVPVTHSDSPRAGNGAVPDARKESISRIAAEVAGVPDE